MTRNLLKASWLILGIAGGLCALVAGFGYEWENYKSLNDGRLVFAAIGIALIVASDFCRRKLPV